MTELNADTPYIDKIEAVRDLYFDFLCMTCGAYSEEAGGSDYSILCRILHETEFYSIVPHDENRMESARELRDRFFRMEEDAGYFHPLDALDFPCSCLEMLIGLAESIEDSIFYGNEQGITSVTLFWEMIHNLLYNTPTNGYGFSDDEIDLQREHDTVVALETLLERTYEPNGYGGLFPLHNPRRDQRKVELWYQANSWVMENYKF